MKTTIGDVKHNPDPHSSCVGLFIPISMIVGIFGGALAIPAHWTMFNVPGWISAIGVVLSTVCFLWIIISGTRSHIVAALIGILSGAFLIPLFFSAFSSVL